MNLMSFSDSGIAEIAAVSQPHGTGSSNRLLEIFFPQQKNHKTPESQSKTCGGEETAPKKLFCISFNNTSGVESVESVKTLSSFLYFVMILTHELVLNLLSFSDDGSTNIQAQGVLC